MTLANAILLGLLQGITEFLPISSSGHLILAESFLKLDVSELKDFDIVLHVATLLAIILYFWRDFLNRKLWPLLILGTVPAAIVGLTLEDQIDALFRSAPSVALMMILIGLLFFIPQKVSGKSLTWARVLHIGIAQAFAIIPGVSRSGATIFTGTMLGLTRRDAARFSFMLGALAIAGAGLSRLGGGLLAAFDVDQIALPLPTLSAGFLAAFFSSLAAVHWLLKFLKNHSLKIFGVYRLLVGALILLLL